MDVTTRLLLRVQYLESALRAIAAHRDEPASADYAKDALEGKDIPMLEPNEEADFIARDLYRGEG